MLQMHGFENRNLRSVGCRFGTTSSRLLCVALAEPSAFEQLALRPCRADGCRCVAPRRRPAIAVLPGARQGCTGQLLVSQYFLAANGLAHSVTGCADAFVPDNLDPLREGLSYLPMLRHARRGALLATKRWSQAEPFQKENRQGNYELFSQW